MADLLVSTGVGVASHLDASWAWNHPNSDPAVQVRLSRGGVVPNNDMNWAVSRASNIGTPPLMWFCDAGTGNHTGPKVLRLLPQTAGGVQVVVQGEDPDQPLPAVTAWKVTATPSDSVVALAATISQTIAGQEWFLCNLGAVADESDATAALTPTSWYLQPSKLAPANLNDFLGTTIDPDESLSAGDAILRIWKGIANTGWDASLASTLLAWLYDFSKLYLTNHSDPFDQATMQRILYGGLYNRTPEYKAYFDSFAPGKLPVAPPPNFGTGAPPPANPPHPPGPHRHVRPPKPVKR